MYIYKTIYIYINRNICLNIYSIKYINTKRNTYINIEYNTYTQKRYILIPKGSSGKTCKGTYTRTSVSGRCSRSPRTTEDRELIYKINIYT